MVRTQILVNKSGGPEQGFQRCFADGLTRSLVPSVAQAKLHIDLPKILLQDRFQLTNQDKKNPF